MMILKSEQRPDEAIKAALNVAIADAHDQWKPLKYEKGYPLTGFGKTNLRARTVGVASDYWSGSLTTSFADWINHTLDDTQYVIITGLFNRTPDPQLTAVFPKANGQDLAIIQVEELWAFGQGAGYFEVPFIVRPNNNLTIQVVGAIAATERLGLLGYELAKRSVLIDTTP